MKTYALISQKGGAGKSTLCTQLAVLASADGPAFLIDRDPQGTARKWWERRQEIEPAPEWPELVDIGGAKLASARAQLEAQAGTLFIDTRPAVTAPEAEAAEVADVVIVPVQPSVNDVEAVGDTLAMIRRLKAEAVIVINRAKADRRARDAKAALSQYGIRVCPHHLADRAVYVDSAIEGRGAGEMRGAAAEAAQAELAQVWDWIRSETNG